MKLLRYGPSGREKPGLLDANGQIRDLSSLVPDISGDTISPAGLKRLSEIDPATLPVVEGNPRLGPCVSGLQKILCIGLNYSDHAAETGAEPPEEPIVFAKALNALCGPNDDVELPRGSKAMDWEVELAVIIGSRTKYVSKDEAMDHVAGFAVMNDISERDFQTKRSGQWTKGKSHDTFGPLGPWLVTKDEVGDPHNLEMWLDVNGERRQTGNSNTLIFDVPTVVSYLSQFMTLMPGDVITTGTPAGVGAGMTPPRFLKIGDIVTLGASGLGEQRLVVVERGA